MRLLKVKGILNLLKFNQPNQLIVESSEGAIEPINASTLTSIKQFSFLFLLYKTISHGH